jgi:hypothetical protein
MMQFYNAETPIEWVIGQVDRQKAHRIFGALHEGRPSVTGNGRTARAA